MLRRYQPSNAQALGGRYASIEGVAMRPIKAVFGAAMFACVLLVAPAAFGASTPAGGSVKLYATPEGNGLRATVLFTGAIGDHGQALTIDKDGTADANGDYVKVTLKNGTFEINSKALNAKANKAQPTASPTTCSATFVVTGPVTVFDGAGLYTGISGTLTVTETFAFIGPRYAAGAKKGQCNESNSAEPIAQYSSIIGTGAVKFS
jgi:hypothetical protein